MTKEIDFLSVSKTSDSSKSVSTSSTSNKKEALSLFDSMLASADTKNKSNTNEQNKTIENKSSTKISKEESPINNDLEEKVEKAPIDTNKKETSKVVNKETSNESSPKQTQDNKNIEVEKTDTSLKTTHAKIDDNTSSKTQSTSNSLLDRMILESKKSDNVQQDYVKANITGDKNLLETDSSILTKDESLEKTLKENNTKVDLKPDSKVVAPENMSTNIDENLENTENTKGENQKEKPLILDKSNLKTEVLDEANNTKIVNPKVVKENTNIENVSNKNLNIENTKSDNKTLEKQTIQTNLNLENELLADEEKTLVTKSNLAIDSKENESFIKENTTLDENSKNSINLTDEPNAKSVNENKELNTKVIEENKPVDSENLTDEPKQKINKLSNQLENIDTTLEDETNKQTKEVIQNVKSDSTETKVVEEKQVDLDIKQNTIDKNINVGDENKVDENESVQIKDLEKETQNKVENTQEPEKNTKTTQNKTSDELISQTKGEKLTPVDNKTLEKQIDPLNDKVKTKVENTNSNLNGLDENSLLDDEEKINIDGDSLKNLKKDTLLNEEPNKVTKKDNSLMNRIFDNTKEQTISTKTLSNETVDEQTPAQKTNDIATNIFLSTQKNSMYTQMIVNKSEGIKTAKDATSMEDIRKSAKTLDLNLENTSVEVESSKDKSTTQTETKAMNTKISLFDKLAFDKSISADELLNKNTISASSSSSTTSSSLASSEETVVNLNVNSNLALSIQNRIIGAQQQMSSMMSDVARNMYENYKPPVTAFRLNLFPAQLGHIAIMMKNDKENSVSISMNMSQSSTHDAFVENQGALRDALNRTFNNTSTNFSLDFNMQEQDSNSSSSSNNQGQNKQNSQSHSSDEIIDGRIENQESSENIDYL